MIANSRKNKKSGLRNGVWLHVCGILVIAVLAGLVFANINMYQKRQEYLVQATALQNQIKSMQAQNEKLKEGIAKENDPAYIEKMARQELDLQKTGETAVSFIAPPPVKPAPVDGENSIHGWFFKSWEWVKDFF